MKSYLYRLLLPTAASCLSVACFGQGHKGPTLGLGSPAPPISVASWLKGTPVTRLGNGKVCVVEFWATWCGPCKASIPHLTEMAHRYKDRVSFIGVDAFENEKTDAAILAKANKFIERMGDRMDYHVAEDGVQGVMAKTWMDASGQDAVPTAFVVDQKGTIVWLGHSTEELDTVLRQILDGTFHIQTVIAKMQADKEAEAKDEEVGKRFTADCAAWSEAVRVGDRKKAIDELDKLVPKYPGFVPSITSAKFYYLGLWDEPAAFKYGVEVSQGLLKDRPDLVYIMARRILNDKTPFKHPDYAAAVTMAHQCFIASGMKEPLYMDIYAYALFKNGDQKGGIAMEEKAIALAKDPARDLEPEELKVFTDRLQLMKSKVKK